MCIKTNQKLSNHNNTIQIKIIIVKLYLLKNFKCYTFQLRGRRIDYFHKEKQNAGNALV